MHGVNYSSLTGPAQSSLIAQQRKKRLQFLGCLLFPCALIKAGYLSIKCCCRIATETRQPLCAMEVFSRAYWWDGESPPNTYTDLAVKAINPCVCCIDWSQLPDESFLFPGEAPSPQQMSDPVPTEPPSFASTSSGSSAASDEPPTPPPPSPTVYPEYFAIPGLGGSSGWR